MKVSFFLIKIIFLLIIIINVSKQEREYLPETYKVRDLIFPGNDEIKRFDYNLIEAKVLTKEEITLYLNKQGIHLTVDDCCKEETDFNAWTQRDMKSDSDYIDIYTNAKYIENNKKITYKFPISRIDNRGYSVHHRLWLFDPKSTASTRYNVYLNEVQICSLLPINNGKAFFELNILVESSSTELDIKYDNYAQCFSGARNLLNEDIKTISFEFQDPSRNYSPAIALHWTYYKIIIAYSNFSLKGNSLCDKITNPCISGYFCVGGVCKKCHPSCYDCVNGALSTDCYSKCNTHSSLRTPDKGTCTIGYVDLNAFDDFDIEDIIPPPRNNRLTISFWMYLNSFPQESVTAYINNSFSENINFFFDFANSGLTIKCAKNSGNLLRVKNSWFFVKCAVSFDHEDDEKDSLFIKYFDGTTKYDYKQNSALSQNRTNCGHDFKKYYEPDDYISLHFYYFNKLRHDQYICNVYMKQLVLFREFLPEPYDNKYFSVEKLLTSTLDLPEVLFVIPFDELKRESNKYKIKCYSYPGDIEINEIILSPKETGDTFSLFPPRLFKRLNLLEKNIKFTSPDLVHTSEITLAANTLIGSNDNVPLSCKDNYFLNFQNSILKTSFDQDSSYAGACNPDCLDRTTIFGLGDRKGFCNRKCDDRPNDKCLSSNNELLHLQTEFQCLNNIKEYYDTFYYCEDKDEEKQKENVFYYDPHFTPGNIVIDVRNYNLKSYIIEYWYNPVDCERITSGYTFYTNQIQVKKVESSYNVYTTAHGSQGFTIDDIYLDKWNHILFEVYYDPREERNYKTRVFMETSLNSGNAQLIDFSENPYPLDYIYFCNGRRASCNNLELNWFCGYYRNLRLFNGILAQRHVTFRYDEYYSNILYLSSIIFYYPLYGSYIANNHLEQFNREKSPLIITSTTNSWNFPQYNYCIKPDNKVTANQSSGDNCKLGFNKQNDKCYECDDNAHFLKKIKGGENIKCEANKNFVLKLPSNVEFEMDPFGINIYSSATVTFFIKVYGFSETGKIDIIYLSDHLKLSYNSNFDDTYFGLNLVTFTGTQEVIVSNYYDFRKHFGLWTFISVATYNEADENYFPPMVRFEINHKKMPIVGPLDNLTIKKIHFSDKVYALVQRINVYNTYFIGAHSYEINPNVKTATNSDIYSDLVASSFFIPQNRVSDCTLDKFISGRNEPYDCVPDDDDLLYFDKMNSEPINKFYEFESESNVASDISVCNSGCNICIGSTIYNCSCNFKNKDSKLFLGNVSNHYCKKFDYVNFAKAEDQYINNIPGSGDKFTLHFWAFAYSYVDKVFEGFEIEWKNHVTVK